MKISFHFDACLPPDTGDLIQRRCEFAFDRFAAVIEGVTVTLTDQNGPKGGESIRCVVRVQLLRRADVIICEQSDAPARAIGLAVDRAAFQIARHNHRRTHASRTQPRGQVAERVSA